MWTVQRYLIGEVSKMVDVPVETIRFLEQRGLITPEKNRENGYRSYSVWDINRILDYKKFRQIGFSSKETVSLVSDCDLPTLLEQLDGKKQDAAYLAHYYQAKTLKMKNFQSVLSHAEQLVGEYYILNRPENYSLFTRSYGTKRLELSSVKATEGGFAEMTRHYPFVEHIFRIKEDWMRQPSTQTQAQWGFTVKKYWADRLGIQLLSKMEHLRAVTALFTVIRIGAQEYFTPAVLEGAMAYMSEHRYELNGDILGIYIATVREQGCNVRYLELWIPIRALDTPALVSSTDQATRLKQIFV